MVVDGCAVASASLVPYADPRAYLLALYPDAEIAPLDDAEPRADPLVARVNHGVWIASCPCGADGEPAPGMIVFIDTPVAWCVRCANAAVGGMWRPVAVPSADERLLIESALNARPLIETRNWEPGETADDLIRENAEHGLGAGV